MGLKEKIFETMMGTMKAEEKKQMMDSMMEKFLGTLSPDEKKAMMGSMMPKMMGSMMGSNGASMMDMMKGMMGSMAGNEGAEKDGSPMGFNPMEMCKKMMATMSKTSDLASFATPEVRALFEEWAAQIEVEILTLRNGKDSVDPDEIAQQFKLSRDSVTYFLTRLAQKGKINLKAEHAEGR
jgi:hypothetical protein